MHMRKCMHIVHVHAYCVCACTYACACPCPCPPCPCPHAHVHAQHAAERLVVDLHCEPTSLLTQPTACFHVATALAIMAAYVHALALEEKM